MAKVPGNNLEKKKMLNKEHGENPWIIKRLVKEHDTRTLLFWQKSNKKISQRSGTEWSGVELPKMHKITKKLSFLAILWEILASRMERSGTEWNGSGGQK